MNCFLRRLSLDARCFAGRVSVRCHFMLAIVLFLTLSGGQALAQSKWPSISLPKEVQSFSIGEQITVNGYPMRMRGFVSALKPEQLAALFRQSLGSPLVENTMAKKLILGRSQGEYYLTVQLEPAGSGSRGVASVTDLKAASENRAAVEENTERWLSRLPSGSQLLSQMTSEDAGKLSTYLLVINTQSEALNYERLKSLMRKDGLELEHEASPTDKSSATRFQEAPNGKTMIFKGAGKEAIATISRDGNGKTAIVLNITKQMEHFK